MRLLISVVALLVASQFALAQKNIEQRDQTWFGYFNQTRFSKRSGVWVDLHYRLTGHFVDERSINIARIAYTYYITDQTRLLVGYAFARQFGAATVPDVNEHRPWQQLQWFEKKNGFNLMQWLRVEERYRQKISAGEPTNDYAFNFRFRYNVAVTVPLTGKTVVPKTPFLFVNDELHINAGNKIVTNMFDQNRLFIGLGYQFTKSLNAHLGYMNVFQQLPGANNFVNIDAIRLFVFHNVDLRKTE